jgi:hypothetical protein
VGVANAAHALGSPHTPRLGRRGSDALCDANGDTVAAYSGTPLARKLGIKPGSRVVLLDAPDGLLTDLAPLPDGVVPARRLTGKPAYDVIVFFAPRASALRARLPRLIPRLTPAGGLWIAWPKKASGVPTDLTEGVVRDQGLRTGLVDNKICAIDDTWSGLRFVRRLRDR